MRSWPIQEFEGMNDLKGRIDLSRVGRHGVTKSVGKIIETGKIKE
jgi:hypothetical protein